MNSQYSIMQKTCIKISVWIFLLSAPLANADAPNVSLERHDEMIQWPAAAPWDGNALTSEYKDVQITRGATGDLLLYLPVTIYKPYFAGILLTIALRVLRIT